METRPYLTRRETEVVRLTSLGCTIEEIGRILGIKYATADCHRLNAMKKLGTDKATLMVRLAIKLKITTMNETLTAEEKRKSGRKNDGWN